jgi:hypothetical protein
MTKKLKEIPEFKNEDEEFEFWSTHDFTDYIDPKSWKRVPAPMVPKTMGLVSFQMTPEITKQVERLSSEKKIRIEDVINQLLAAGLKDQGLQPSARR